jgi:branched-chain amino acid transport system permease protein/neutral amino acid transport system permease protein
VGFTLQFGVTNILNLAFGDVMTASAFIGYIATTNGANIWVAVALCAVFGGVFSMLLNRWLYTPFVRHGTKLFGMIIVTIAVSLIIQNTLQAIWGPNFFSLKFSPGRSYHLGAMVFTTSQFGIMAIAVVAMVGVYALLRHTKLGKAMRATASDPALARSCGIATDRVIDVGWLVSGALCGIAGIALAMNVTSFTSTTGGTFLIAIVAAAVLGGVGQAYGAMLGALTIGLSSEVAAGVIAPSYKQVVAFAVLVIVLLIRPQGILSEVADEKEVVA